jgi:hypothetical protein
MNNIKLPHRFLISIVLTLFMVGCLSKPSQLSTSPEPTQNSPISEPTDVKVADPSTTPGDIISLQQMKDIVYTDPDVSIANDDGSETRMGPPGTLPRGLPEDLPVFPPEELYIDLSWTIWKTPGEANLDYNVNVQTVTDIETVHEWFKSQLESNGWTIDSEISNPINTEIWAIIVEINASKAERTLKITIGNTGDSPLRTNISLYTSVLEAN